MNSDYIPAVYSLPLCFILVPSLFSLHTRFVFLWLPINLHTCNPSNHKAPEIQSSFNRIVPSLNATQMLRPRLSLVGVFPCVCLFSSVFLSLGFSIPLCSQSVWLAQCFASLPSSSPSWFCLALLTCTPASHNVFNPPNFSNRYRPPGSFICFYLAVRSGDHIYVVANQLERKASVHEGKTTLWRDRHWISDQTSANKTVRERSLNTDGGINKQQLWKETIVACRLLIQSLLIHSQTNMFKLDSALHSLNIHLNITAGSHSFNKQFC